jgi:hypothetical protein
VDDPQILRNIADGRKKTINRGRIKHLGSGSGFVKYSIYISWNSPPPARSTSDESPFIRRRTFLDLSRIDDEIVNRTIMD